MEADKQMQQQPLSGGRLASCAQGGYNMSNVDMEGLAYLEKAIESLAGAESEYANRRYNNCANLSLWRHSIRFRRLD